MLGFIVFRNWCDIGVIVEMKSLMVIPYISNKTLTRYFQYLIDGYTYQPELIRYYPNDPAKPMYQQYLDYKVIDSFAYHQPTDYIIYHASDIYLMPDDLGNMMRELEQNDNAFCIGIYPITDFDDTKMNETPIIPTRVGIWKADMFQKYLAEFKELDSKSSQGLMVDEIYRMGELAVRDKLICLTSKTARPFRMWRKEFRVASL